MEFGIIWILFLAGVLFLVFFMSKKMRVIKKAQNESKIQFEENRAKFRVFTSEMFDEIPTNELTHAVLFHIMGKEDKLYEGDAIVDEGLISLLTHGEKLIYTIYQVELSMGGGRGSIHSFFIDDKYSAYRPYAKEAFEAVSCHEIANLIAAAARLNHIIEEDLDDEENDIEGDYASYNFADYTNELMSLLKSTGIVELAGKYIKENKEQFIDSEVEENEEGISE